MSVTKIIDNFAKQSGNGAFPNISRSDVVKGLRERVRDPWKIDQGAASLCGPAALLFSVLKRDPEMYVKYVTNVYNDGEAALGKTWGIWVTPSKACRSHDPAGKMPAVDWVALASLRDSENDVWSYSSTEDQASGITPPVTLSLWMKETGFTDRKNETNLFWTKGKENLKTASGLHLQGHRVSLFCKGDTLKKKEGGTFSIPTHWVVITKGAVFTGDKVKIQLFSWGTLYDIDVELDVFLSTYFGFVSGKP